jgi:hypothetical protein
MWPPVLWLKKGKGGPILTVIQVLNSAEYYLPLYFQSAKGASPLRSGLLLLPLILTEAFTGVAGGIYIHHFGRYVELIWVGVVLLTVGNGLYIRLDATSTIGSIAAFEVLSGLGVGLLVSRPLLFAILFRPHQ